MAGESLGDQMPGYIPDSSAIISVLVDEPGAPRVVELLNQAEGKSAQEIFVPFMVLMKVEHWLLRHLSPSEAEHGGAIPVRRRYRLYPGVPIDPKRWQKHYNKRTAVERVNSRLKEFAKLDNLKVRGLAKIQLHSTIAVLVIQTARLSLLCNRA